MQYICSQYISVHAHVAQYLQSIFNLQPEDLCDVRNFLPAEPIQNYICNNKSKKICFKINKSCVYQAILRTTYYENSTQ